MCGAATRPGPAGPGRVMHAPHERAAPPTRTPDLTPTTSRVALSMPPFADTATRAGPTRGRHRAAGDAGDAGRAGAYPLRDCTVADAITTGSIGISVAG